ncbi:hypothetical protein POSPLADRAFT_1074370 [Postia placenta MAD-698-R-SB12]|uniref:TauD/TfdA-like domain-containing protein n=1 Tax=Postia placenta MAD-698-R-SB12 TaxID=670580 RepID=A0A1X6N0C1_9APHY|nr:hypothetical protein POSPLADRAFT_1074370 [Postia placenta MAD-698-R-SB12]OSX61942.1 hypothetical protein POSPLADRAFT_1074370 [Postia placenta MAD-698-R-SB12]
MSSTATTTLTETFSKLSVRASTEPLKPTGALDKYDFVDITPVIGREYPNVQLTDLLNAEDADELIRELAIIVSQRNVVFFRNQNIEIEQQKKAHPALSLHSKIESGPEIHVISSTKFKQLEQQDNFDLSQLASRGWHSDITFEPVPSDFAILKIHTLPETGGDTVWASGYEAYDRLSPALAKHLEGLTAIHEASKFKRYVESHGKTLYDGERGNPENVGADLRAVHPVIRTNPVTGWKALFVNKNFTRRILELTKDESDATLDYLFKLVNDNHDLQVRFKWNKNDVAIWANPATFHNVTRDYDDLREGDRVVSLGERPYYDPNSKSRRDALGQKKRIFGFQVTQ